MTKRPACIVCINLFASIVIVMIRPTASHAAESIVYPAKELAGTAAELDRLAAGLREFAVADADRIEDIKPDEIQISGVKGQLVIRGPKSVQEFTAQLADMLVAKAVSVKHRVAIVKAFDEPTEFDFEETPLTDVVQYLTAKHHIPIQLNTKVLSDSGVGADMPITLHVRGIRLWSGLNRVVRPLDLGWTIQDNLLLIVTKRDSQQTTWIKSYDVSTLIHDEEQASRLVTTIRKLTRLAEPAHVVDPIGLGVAPPEEPTPAAKFQMLYHRQRLVVQAPTDMQQQVRKLLEDMRDKEP